MTEQKTKQAVLMQKWQQKTWFSFEPNKISAIEMQDNSILKLFFLSEWKDFDISISQNANNSEIEICIVNFCNKSSIKWTIQSIMTWDKNKCSIKILNLLKESKADIRSKIIIAQSSKWNDGNLDQSNYCFDSNSASIWIPELVIMTKEAKARHALKNEQIDNEKLFFLTSRWIPTDIAENMFIKMKVSEIFSWINVDYSEQLDKIVENF